MKEFIGVYNFANVPTSTKQLLLMFDRIALPLYSESGINSERLFAFSEKSRHDYFIEIDFLYEQGILFDPIKERAFKKYTPSDNEYLKHLLKEFPKSSKLHDKAQKKYENFLNSIVPDNEDEKSKLLEVFAELKRNYIDAQVYYGSHMATLESLLLNLEMNIDSVPIYSRGNSGFLKDYDSNLKQDTLNITLDNFPIPDGNTSLEDILEFRSDSDSKIKFTRLRHWMNKVATKEIKQKEIQDELDCLLFEYQQHMEFHRIKTTSGHFESFITGTAELLEDIAKIKWGKAAKNIFSFKHKKIALLEAELSAPGKEVAYIAKVNTHFDKKV